jgi:threonine/homoserine/homoserine lactone efflux protein
MPEATIPLIFITSFVIALSGALAPGPLLVVAIREAAQRGFWVGPMLILGHGILELLLVVALALGLSEFMAGELVLGIIGLVGGIVLVGMGSVTVVRGWRGATVPVGNSPSHPLPRRERSGEGGDAPQSFPLSKTKMIGWGTLASLSNPYWFLWWATLGVTYMVWSLRLGVPGVTSFFTGHILADFTWYSLVTFIIATGRKLMSDAIYRGLLVACGLALLAMGGYFIVSGLGFIGV